MRGKVSAVVLALFLTGLLAGCGGGGGGSSTSLHGEVHLCRAAENPKLAIIEVNGSGGWYTLKCMNMNKPSSYWGDVGFRIGMPSWQNGRVCTAVVFNDYNNNGTYDNWNNEVLGFMDGCVVGDSSRDQWYLVDNSFNYIGDVNDHSVYIICQFERSGTADIDKLKQESMLEMMKKVRPTVQ